MAKDTRNRSAPKGQRETGVYNVQFHGQASTHYRGRFGSPMTPDQLASPATFDNPVTLTRKRAPRTQI